MVKIVMYERQFKRSFHRTNGVRAWSIFRHWQCACFALGLCLVGCLSCGVHREFIHVIEVDKDYHADTDTCTVEVWRQYLPRRITKFRVK